MSEGRRGFAKCPPRVQVHVGRPTWFRQVASPSPSPCRKTDVVSPSGLPESKSMSEGRRGFANWPPRVQVHVGRPTWFRQVASPSPSPCRKADVVSPIGLQERNSTSEGRHEFANRSGTWANRFPKLSTQHEFTRSNVPQSECPRASAPERVPQSECPRASAPERVPQSECLPG
jgi:hypothetical protein